MSALLALSLFALSESNLADGAIKTNITDNIELRLKKSAHQAQYQPVQQLFDGMREHNAEKIANAFAKDATLVRARQNGLLKMTDIPQFASSIAKRKKDYMDEQIINYRIESFGNLANIWTYFVFYFNGKISHCGVNSIHVIQQNSDWKIAHLMDTAHQGSCEEFIAQNQ